MFNGDKEKSSNEIETLIGEQCSIIGSIKGTELIKIDGHIEGDIVWSDDVILGVSALCEGNITSKNALICGRVNGNICCEESLTIENSGIVNGDVTLKNIMIKEGGMLQGKCSMTHDKVIK